MTIKTWQERFAAHPMATSDVAKLAEIEELRAKLAEYEKRHQTIGNAGTACGEYVEPEKYNPAPVYTSNCIRHPGAPHGVDVDASWRAGKTVCMCQSWTPGEAS